MLTIFQRECKVSPNITKYATLIFKTIYVKKYNTIISYMYIQITLYNAQKPFKK